VDGYDPNRTGTISLGLTIKDTTGFLGGLDPSMTTGGGSGGALFVIRVRNGVATTLYTEGPVIWTGQQNGLNKDVQIATSDLLPNDIICLYLSYTNLIINGRQYFLTEFLHIIDITDSIPRANDMARILGLVHDNTYVSNTFVDGDHTESTIELYDTKINAETHDGVTGLIGKYKLNVTNAGGLPTEYQMVRDA
jgi:hypothetical protein